MISTTRDTVHDPVEAVTVTFVLVATPSVSTLNVFSVLPSVMETDPGIAIAELDELSETSTPPGPAGAESRTRNVTVRPPVVLPEPKM